MCLHFDLIYKSTTHPPPKPIVLAFPLLLHHQVFNTFLLSSTTHHHHHSIYIYMFVLQEPCSWWSLHCSVWLCLRGRRICQMGERRNERFLFWSCSPLLIGTTAFWWVLDLLGRVFMVPLCLFSLSSSERLSML